MVGQIMLSIVIPVWNEAQSIPELAEELRKVLDRLEQPFEVIFVNDGSTDQTADVLRTEQRKDPRFKWVTLRAHFGKSAALAAGFARAAGEFVITMDGDLQDDPREIPNFLSKLGEGHDVVSGWKRERKDSLWRLLLSKLYNLATAFASGIPLHDFNCGFKAYRQSVLKEIHLYGEFHRYIPLLAAWRGFAITEIQVQHRARKYGKSKYGPGRILSGLLDLLTVTFLTRFTKKPAHFFGTIGLLVTLSGIAVNAYIAYLRFHFGNIQSRYPLLFLGVLLTIVGIQFLSTGLLAEMITFGQKRTEREYSIRDERL
jgi:glycosyltransferase involved in cell wall biosynthesis